MSEEVQQYTGSVPAQRMAPGTLGKFDANAHDWNDLQSEAIDLGGADLLGKELIDFLVKVPHTVVGVSFYQGKALENGHDGAFVSATAMIAPEDILRKRFKGNEKASTVEALPFDAEDIVVYNDGSTGLYRQVVRALADKGYILLTPKGEGILEGGGSGESTYDLHPSKWAGITNDTSRARELPKKDDGSWGGVEFYIRISAPRGIRYSEYEGPTGPARTRYIG